MKKPRDGITGESTGVKTPDIVVRAGRVVCFEGIPLLEQPANMKATMMMPEKMMLSHTLQMSIYSKYLRDLSTSWFP
jgi:pantothenate kinase